MSAINPPGVIAGALQAGGVQRQTAAEQSSEESRQAQFSRELRAADQAVEVEIEATDADTRVHADAGGQGGSGRQGSEEGAEAAGGDAVATPDEAVEPGRLDVSA